MLEKIAALPRLSKAQTAAGRIARLEERVDLLTRLIGNMTGGLGVSVNLLQRDMIEISADGGGGSVVDVAMSWLAEDTVDGGNHTISHRGGTVEFLGGGATTFQDGEHEAGGDDAYCFLYWDASYNNAAGRWTREIDEDGYPATGDMDDGDVFIPLWKLVDGVLTQETLGAIVIPAVKNVVDRAEYT